LPLFLVYDDIINFDLFKFIYYEGTTTYYIQLSSFCIIISNFEIKDLKRIDNMFKKDLEKRYITFNFPKDIPEQNTRFVLYNEKDKEFPILSNMHSKEDYLKIDTLSLKPHFQYKYKFQIRRNNEWVTAKPYQYLHINFKNENNVKYRLFREPESKHLLVCFSGNGNVPAYNYIGAFSDLKVNRLYIKDDFTSKTFNKSVFYVGTNQKNEVMDYISDLIETISKKINVDKKNIICCGTSKGGYAAILYALTYGYGHCVVGSPTIYLGNSLLVEGNLREHAKIISGNINQSSIKWMNNILLSKTKTTNTCKINVIIGEGERRYNKHLLPFMEFVKDNKNIVFQTQVEDFKEHKKIAKFYPPFARNTISNILKD